MPSGCAPRRQCVGLTVFTLCQVHVISFSAPSENCVFSINFNGTMFGFLGVGIYLSLLGVLLQGLPLVSKRYKNQHHGVIRAMCFDKHLALSKFLHTFWKCTVPDISACICRFRHQPLVDFEDIRPESYMVDTIWFQMKPLSTFIGIEAGVASSTANITCEALSP